MHDASTINRFYEVTPSHILNICGHSGTGHRHLTADERARVREAYADGRTQRAIATEHGITQPAVSRIINSEVRL